VSEIYPLKFTPIYKEKIWGGRSLERLFARALPPGQNIGESWELADLPEGVSVVSNGLRIGATLTELTEKWGRDLLGDASPSSDGRFPLLLKLLDANERLSLQVHPDERAVTKIGPAAVLKTECWYIIESRNGYIYKGVKPGVTGEEFRKAIEIDSVEQEIRRIDLTGGDFHYLPAGTVHAIGRGVVIAEVQTPSDTTYRVTDWGRGREIHVERSMQCIRFDLTEDLQPGCEGDTLLVTDYFTVARRTCQTGTAISLPGGRCVALMVLTGRGVIPCEGGVVPPTEYRPGDTLLIPAGLGSCECHPREDTAYLEITLPG
jgi:mannose-6-phosphate isomerase